MRIRILDSALEDLDRGRKFYDRQGEGLGGFWISVRLPTEFDVHLRENNRRCFVAVA
jgi:hypothetical protein